MSEGDMGFVHEVAYYEDATDLVAATAPALRQALARGEDVALVCSDRNNRALHESLDDDDRVVVLPRREVYQKAVSAIDYAYDFVEARREAGSGRLTVVGEVTFGGCRASEEWRRYEALLNHVMTPFPVSAICTYDTQALPREVLATAELTHPHVRAGSERVRNPGFVDPARLLRRVEGDDEVLPRTAPGLSLQDVVDLAGLRRDLLAVVTADGIGEERAEDMVAAVHEVVTNGLRHGEPPVNVRLWCLPGQVVCTVTDRGPGFDDPFVGYVRGGGKPLAEGQYGLWLARELCDEVFTAHTDEGFEARLTIHR